MPQLNPTHPTAQSYSIHLIRRKFIDLDYLDSQKTITRTITSGTTLPNTIGKKSSFKKSQLKNRVRLGTSKSVLFENQKDMMLSTSALANALNCSISYIKRLRARGIITPTVSFPRYVRFNYSDVVVALQKRSLL